MAVDLFCYSVEPVAEVQRKIDLLSAQHKGLFAERFLIYKAGNANQIHKKIVLEHGLNASSEFMVSLNDKSAADLVPTVVLLIKYALGDGGVIIMSDGVLR